MYRQTLGIVTDTEYVVLTPSVEPPPDDNGVPPDENGEPPTPVNWTMVAVLGLVSLLVISGSK